MHLPDLRRRWRPSKTKASSILVGSSTSLPPQYPLLHQIYAHSTHSFRPLSEWNSFWGWPWRWFNGRFIHRDVCALAQGLSLQIFPAADPCAAANNRSLEEHGIAFLNSGRSDDEDDEESALDFSELNIGQYVWNNRYHASSQYRRDRAFKDLQATSFPCSCVYNHAILWATWCCYIVEGCVKTYQFQHLPVQNTIRHSKQNKYLSGEVQQ